MVTCRMFPSSLPDVTRPPPPLHFPNPPPTPNCLYPPAPPGIYFAERQRVMVSVFIYRLYIFVCIISWVPYGLLELNDLAIMRTAIRLALVTCSLVRSFHVRPAPCGLSSPSTNFLSPFSVVYVRRKWAASKTCGTIQHGQ